LFTQNFQVVASFFYLTLPHYNEVSKSV